MSGTAVVFDSAGTLLHMYRAAKNLINGTICYDIVILHIDPDTLMQIDESYLIHQFLEEARLIINFDSRAIVSDLHEVLQAVSGRCDNRRYMGVGVYIASGDKQQDVELIAGSIGVKKEHTFGLSTPRRKGEIVMVLKESYDKVVMGGDAINDIMAFKQADFAVLTVQQRNVRPEKLSSEADAIIDNISQIVPLVGDLI